MTPPDSESLSPPKSEAPKEEASSGPKAADTTPSPKDSEFKFAPSPGKGPTKSERQKYPLYPSVSQLLHENGLDQSEADKIPASGPHGRLLKGDVLAHLGTIDAAYPGKQADRISKLEHLDLSNIKVAPPAQSKALPKAAAMAEPAPVEEHTDVEVAIPISLEAVAQVQRRIKRTLGFDVPVETFIARAISLSNAGLPPPKTAPTADELFDDILGVARAEVVSTRGSFLPNITSPLSGASLAAPAPHKPQLDVYDLLTGAAPQRRAASYPVTAPAEVSDVLNVFSVKAPKGEEHRATLFLERMKSTLQDEPGSLIM